MLVAGALLAAIARGEPTADLALVGDLMFGRYVGSRMRRDGSSRIFDGARHELTHSDLAIGNLECAVSDRPFGTQKRFLLRASSDCAKSMADGGVGVVSIANNHALDCGPQGLADELATLATAHLMPVGLDQSRGIVVTRKGIKLGILAYCDFAHDSGGSGIAYTDEGRVTSEIGRLRRKVDDVIVYWHWGVELSPLQTSRQAHLARLAAQAGADLVVGCHPHVLQPIEWVKGRSGRRTLVAYSLGNFVFDSRPGPQSRTEILHVTFSRSGAQSFRVNPYQIRHCRPEPVASPRSYTRPRSGRRA